MLGPEWELVGGAPRAPPPGGNALLMLAAAATSSLELLLLRLRLATMGTTQPGHDVAGAMGI